ncbi:MAG: polyamine aminopropyltransferase [Planctomycetota bacterium]
MTTDDAEAVPARRGDSAVLLASVFLVASCSLVYELVAGAVSSYLLGSSVTQFSLVIGLFLTAMGLGSYLTQYLRRDLVAWFVRVEVAIGVLGGASALILFAAFTYTEVYMTAMVAVAGGVGTLIGLEIPLIIRILREREASLRLTVANVMTVDYVGALAAALAFPFLLVPHLGLMRAAFAAGLLNLAVAWLGLVRFADEIPRMPRLRAWTLAATLALLAGLAGSERLLSLLEARIYPDEVIYARQTAYQRIVLTKWREDVRLFLNGNLQFASRDEHRYHESLVHPAAMLAGRRARVLILGGGDGMVAREVLKYDDVRTVDLVDIDPEMTRLFRDQDLLAALNDGALRDPRVTVHNRDAMRYLEETDRFYDLIYMDLPDPSVLELGKLYSRTFYRLAARRLDPNGMMAVQSTSPFFAPEAFWCIVRTLRSVAAPSQGAEATLWVAPYRATVPSFGIWGFCLVAPKPRDVKAVPAPTAPTRFLNAATMADLFDLPADLQPVETEVNRLDNQILVRYYNRGYRQFYD